jgi:hypothetical protein
VVAVAAPKKGASYTGSLSDTGSRISKRVVLKVSSKGTTGRVRLECGGTRIGVSSKFSISKGKFTAKKTTGSLLVWRLKGGLKSSEKGKGQALPPGGLRRQGRQDHAGARLSMGT